MMRFLIKKNDNHRAFTLAEVLITLAIIGVVAAMTIPSMLNKINDAELKTGFKKIYSELDQATKKVIQDNGGTMKGLCPDTDHNCLKDKYSSFIGIKNCNNGQSFGICWHAEGEWKTLKGSPVTGFADSPGYILSNGSLIRFIMDKEICDLSGWTAGNSIGSCGYINVDVNGFKKPNTIGKDIFYIHIYQNGLAPFGVSDDDGTDIALTTCSKNEVGHGCAAKVLMNQDY